MISILNKNRNLIEKIYVALVIAALVVIYVLKFYTAIKWPFLQEYREMTMIKFAEEFARGVNPYSLKALESEIPQVTSVYGVLPALMCAPFVFIFTKIGVSALIVCRVLTLAVEVLCLVLVGKTLEITSGKEYISVSGMALTAACFWRYRAFGGAFPDQWGMFMNFLLMYLVIRDEKREQYEPVKYAAILVGCFYVKQYFVFSVIGLLVYMFIHSKKDLIRLIYWGAGLTIASLIIVQLVFPLYLSEALPISQGSTESFGFGWSIGQVVFIARHYFLVPILVTFGVLVYNRVPGTKSYALLQIICIFPLVLVIARNSGTYATYWLQLWFIYVVIVIMQIVADVPYVIPMITTVLFMYQCRSILIEKPHDGACFNSWQEAYDTLDELGADGNILADAHFSLYLQNHGIETSEYGQCEYSGEGSLNNVRESALWSKFPYAIKILEKNIAYENTVREKLKKHEYSVVAFSTIYHYTISDEELSEYGYKMVKRTDLEAGNLVLDTYFWVPEE